MRTNLKMEGEYVVELSFGTRGLGLILGQRCLAFFHLLEISHDSMSYIIPMWSTFSVIYLQHLQDKMRECNINYITVLLSEIYPDKLELFQEIDA